MQEWDIIPEKLQSKSSIADHADGRKRGEYQIQQEKLVSGKQKECEDEQSKSEMDAKIQAEEKVVIIRSSHEIILVAKENRKVKRFPLVLDLKNEIGISARRNVYRNNIVPVQHLLIASLEIIAHLSNHFH